MALTLPIECGLDLQKCIILGSYLDIVNIYRQSTILGAPLDTHTTHTHTHTHTHHWCIQGVARDAHSISIQYFTSRIFPGGGGSAPTPKSATVLFFNFLAETLMKMEEFGSRGRVPGAPLGSANDFHAFSGKICQNIRLAVHLWDWYSPPGLCSICIILARFVSSRCQRFHCNAKKIKAHMNCHTI